MSTFAELSSRQGVGVTYYFGVSIDNGATALAYYGTHSISLGAAGWTEPRVLKLGALARALDVSGLASSTIDVELDNVDGALDWLSNRDTVASQLFKSTWYLNCYVFDPANPTDSATMTLGVFSSFEMPRRGPSSISLTLADASSGQAAELAETPTLRDIAGDLFAAGILPVADIDGCETEIPPDEPLQLAFGGNFIPVRRVMAPGKGLGATVCYIVCCTTDTAFAGTDYVTLYLGAKHESLISSNFNGSTIYTISRGATTVTKGGKSWKVIWLNLFASAITNGYIQTKLGLEKIYGGGLNDDSWELCGYLDQAGGVWVQGQPLSARTYTYADYYQMHGADLLSDLVTYYAQNALTMDATSVATAKQLMPMAMVSGAVTPGVSSAANGGVLRQTLADVARSAFIDLFVAWGGGFKVTPRLVENSYLVTTNTYSTLDETLVLADSIAERIPSAADRWAPLNRAYVTDYDVAHGLAEVKIQNQSSSTWGRIIAESISAPWGSVNTAILSAFATIRPVISFRYPMAALNFEIGDYVKFGWTRGGSIGPYAATTFWKVEGLALDPESCCVDVALVWMGDIRTDYGTADGAPPSTVYPYILDDETRVTRVSSGGGRTATVQNGVTTVTFSSGSLITDGVQQWDLLVLLDSTLAADVFTRFRALQISGVTDATHLTVYGSTAFDAAGPTAVVDWKIVKGFQTYPTLSRLYGKVTDASGNFADASPTIGNQLLSG